jgi:hypothetical protein
VILFIAKGVIEMQRTGDVLLILLGIVLIFVIYVIAVGGASVFF